MGLFNTILQKLGFMKDKAVEAVAGETAAAAEAPAAPAEAAPMEAAAVETVAAAAPAAADAPAAAPETVDVVAVCEALAAKNPAETQLENLYCRPYEAPWYGFFLGQP